MLALASETVHASTHYSGESSRSPCQCGVRAAGQALRNAGRWCELEQSPQPGLVGRRTQFNGLHIEAVKLFPQSVCQLIAFASQVLVYPRESSRSWITR